MCTVITVLLPENHWGSAGEPFLRISLTLPKKAYITPIHKGGNQKEPKNFRPVALTSHLAKALEKLVLKEMVKFLQLSGQLNPEQHGFCSGRSTTSQLVQHMENIVERLEEGDAVDVIYLDFAKTFDKVDHGILLRTLLRLGV